MKTLKKQRRMVGLCQYELSRAAGISLWRISSAETGRITLTPEEIEKVRTALARRAVDVAAALAVGKSEVAGG